MHSSLLHSSCAREGWLIQVHPTPLLILQAHPILHGRSWSLFYPCVAVVCGRCDALSGELSVVPTPVDRFDVGDRFDVHHIELRLTALVDA